MKRPSTIPIKRTPGLRRAISDRRGSTAVEFAIVAPAFLALMFSTFEAGWFYFANSQLDAAVLDASRFIRTGQAQEQGFDKDAFYNHVCPRLEIFGQCSERLTVEVDTFASFAELAADNSAAVCSTDSAEDIAAIPYNPGLDNEIVRVRFCLIYNTINPTIGLNLSETANGTRKLYGSYLFRNEPFSRNQV
ncbi:MAG: TadE/TadG family type IV pilus assembly protein [Pseudomonadota bacterium]